MSNRILLFICVAAPMVVPGFLNAQTPQTPGIIIPSGSGGYYQSPAGLIPMRGTFLMPLFQNTAWNSLSLGGNLATVDLPGPRAAFGITETRPTFFVRGLSPDTGLYLVRESHKEDFRRLNMPVSRNISQWAHFRSKDLTELDTDLLDPDVTRVKPHVDLKPGDYILVSDLESRFRAMHMGFEFHVMGATPAP